MVKLDKVVTGISAYLKDKLYPSLDSGNRMKISAALYVVKSNPLGAATVALRKFLPMNVAVEKALEIAAELGILDADGNVNADLLLGLAKEHIAEFGELSVNLLGVEIELSEANIVTLGEYIKARG